MFAGLDGTSWLTALLMALTVSIGILGIFQEHHTDAGKLTRVGWTLIAAISLFGLLTFVSARRDRYAADQKERSESAERARQFQSQMAELSRLQRQMQSSLRSQRELAGTAEQNLRMSGRLQTQAQANTARLLRNVFEEANRITGHDITARIGMHCSELHPLMQHPSPILITLSAEAFRDHVRVSALDRTGDPNGATFTNFFGDLRRFEFLTTWRGATLSVAVAITPPVLRELSLIEYNQSTAEERENAQRIPPDFRCSVNLNLYLRGRFVLVADAQMTREPNRYIRYIARFRDLRIDSARLPRAGSFEADRER